MREIKFRAWNGEQMVSPDYIDNRGIAHWRENSIPTSTDKIMQYTGLKDKNGKEIYEGDIVRMANPYTSKLRGSEVIYTYAQFAIIADDDFIPLGDIQNWEIIGNVYENPELLKG